MSKGQINSDVIGLIREDRVLALEQAMIRIPSSSFEEQKLADYLAEHMLDRGLSVEMMTVPHPWDAGKSTRQPVGWLKGTGGGKCLMLNGHMDPGVEMSGWTVDPYAGLYEEGWVWGIGAHDDKGGLAAALADVRQIGPTKLGVVGEAALSKCPLRVEPKADLQQHQRRDQPPQGHQHAPAKHTALRLALSPILDHGGALCSGRTLAPTMCRGDGLGWSSDFVLESPP